LVGYFLKEMKKQLLLFVLMLWPMVTFADVVEIDGIYYNLIKKAKTAEVTSNPNYYSGSVVVPDKINYENTEYSVTSIGDIAFYACSGLTSITIPNSVTSIGREAFRICSGLTSITIPNSVTSIGVWAFQYCSGLTSVTISNNLTTIKESVFGDCTGLTSITIPNSVTSIERNAFGNCYRLTSVNISDLETWCKISFGDYNSNPLSYAHHLFLNGEEIKDLVIPNSVTSIGQYAFYACSGLTSVTIPNSAKTIGDGAFSNCSGLTSITIGNGIQIINTKAFANCTELTDVYCLAENVPQMMNNKQTCTDAFEGSYIEYATLHVPAASVNAYKATAPWSNFKTIMGIEETTSENTINGHEYVDLGLPSGKCWATMNYGATSPEGYGSYLEWSSNSIISSNWGSGWTTPSLQDIRELENNCTWTWGQKNGHSGYTVKGKNGNSIFLPASGYMMMGQSSAGKVDQWVYYWTSTKSGEMASIILSTATDVWYGEMNTVYTKLPIRPITKESHSTVVQKCETPIISYNNGKLTFACSTEDATCQYSITDSDIKVGSGNEVLLSVTYNISVYATKAGYENSETATATLCWIDQQPATEGITDGIANVPAKALLIKNNGGQLTIEGAADGEAIDVYTINGVKKGSIVSQNGVASIDTNIQSGNVAIVKIKNKSVKVAIK
jgi:hypothetical protein